MIDLTKVTVRMCHKPGSDPWNVCTGAAQDFTILWPHTPYPIPPWNVPHAAGLSPCLHAACPMPRCCMPHASVPHALCPMPPYSMLRAPVLHAACLHASIPPRSMPDAAMPPCHHASMSHAPCLMVHAAGPSIRSVSSKITPFIDQHIRLQEGIDDVFDFVEDEPDPENRSSRQYLFHVPNHPTRCIEMSAWSRKVKQTFFKFCGKEGEVAHDHKRFCDASLW